MPGPDIPTIHRCHYGWDRSLAPACTVEPGQEVELWVRDASDGQITEHATAADLVAMDAQRVNPVNGPVAVEGARPKDALCLEILELEGTGWGWTGLIPGFGLLADQFPEPFVHVSRYDGRSVEFLPGIEIPQRSFPGTVGVAPAEPGSHGIIPPRRVGGNMDFRGLVPGAKVWLPVEVSGALWSLGDTHAAQGHGEVCGTAVETSMRVRVRCELEPGAAPRFPRFRVPDGHSVAPGPQWVTSGVGPDLWQGLRDAVREMIDLVMARHGLSAEHAYCLISVAGDLGLAEVVDAPHWMATVHLPESVFRG